ncbi:MAG: OsmC family protein [Pseudomonadota bacterium]
MSTDLLEPTAPVTTIHTALRPIDRDGLMAFAEKGRNNPASRGTNKVHTVMEGQYRSLSTVGNHAPVVVDEPLHLFGQDTAPAPGEIVLSGLGGCLAVGITAVATWKQVQLSKIEIFMEGDIGNPAAWGAGGALQKLPPEMGFQAIRVKVLIEGDAPREVLDEIVQHANFYSPVANSMRNPIPFEISLAD